MNVILLWLDAVMKALAGQVAALLALIVVNLLLAVALAIRSRKFEWVKLADFYRSQVIPLLLGWLAWAVLAKFAGPQVLGEQYGYLAGDGVVWLSWLAVVATIGAKIVSNAKALYGTMLPIKPKA